MSVSDIVAIKQDGKVSYHYCDSMGFQEVPAFLPDNPLKSRRNVVEDDYGMIDGIINNGTKEPTVARAGSTGSQRPVHLPDGFGCRRPPGISDKKVCHGAAEKPSA